MTHHSQEEKEKLAAFFTEDYWAERLCKLAGISDQDTILDPTCGYGSLIKAAIKEGADPEKCFGTDIDAKSIEVCKSIGANFRVKDALSKQVLDPGFWIDKPKFGVI